MDTARAVSGKLKLEVRPMDVAEVIEKAEEVVRTAAGAKGIALDTRLDRSVGQITGDPDRLQQVVWNLLSNAVKFTQEGGRIEVRLERVDPHVQITIRDTRQGIKPEFLPYVFERWWLTASRSADGVRPRRRPHRRARSRIPNAHDQAELVVAVRGLILRGLQSDDDTRRNR